MYEDYDLLPLSALQHLQFCRRQCGLIHLEQIWSDNRLTAEGNLLHQKVHDSGDELNGDIRILRGLRLRSLKLGFTGIADVVELHRPDQSSPKELQVTIRQYTGLWFVRPVEYKRGRPKKGAEDEVQLCAQAICLEEMLDVSIPEGDLFYGKTHRRKRVQFDHRLRNLVEQLAIELHGMMASGKTPEAEYSPKCDKCSLLDICMPRKTASQNTASKYVQRQIENALSYDSRKASP